MKFQAIHMLTFAEISGTSQIGKNKKTSMARTRVFPSLRSRRPRWPIDIIISLVKYTARRAFLETKSSRTYQSLTFTQEQLFWGSELRRAWCLAQRLYGRDHNGSGTHGVSALWLPEISTVHSTVPKCLDLNFVSTKEAGGTAKGKKEKTGL